MNTPHISCIAALGTTTRAIGKNNTLLWRIKEDLGRFKSLTTGHPIIMGRKNFESIGRPLPNRTNIVITRNKEYAAEGCFVVHSFDEAVTKAKEVEEKEIFIIGGGEIYTQALPITHKLYLTLVDSNETGDVFFPDYSGFK